MLVHIAYCEVIGVGLRDPHTKCNLWNCFLVHPCICVSVYWVKSTHWTVLKVISLCFGIHGTYISFHKTVSNHAIQASLSTDS